MLKIKESVNTGFWGDIFLPGPGANDLVALLKDLPITASVRGNWDDCVLEALDGEYGLEDPQEIQSMRMTQFLMERMNPATIVWLRSLPLLEKKEVDGWCAFLSLIIYLTKIMGVTCWLGMIQKNLTSY